MADENINKGISFASYMPGFIGAGASLLGSFLSNTSADRQAEKQFERQKKLAEIQQEYNKELMDKQSANNMRDWQQQFNVQSRYDISNAYNNASRQVQALKQAGLNPASGISPYTSVTPSPSGGTTSLGASSQGSASAAGTFPFSFGNPVDFMQLAQNAPLAKAQARKLNAEAETQELENLGTREENSFYDVAVVPLPEPTFDKAGNLILADIPALGHRTKKGVIAMRTAQKHLEQLESSLDLQISQADLQAMINNKQIKDDDVIKALVKMPSEQFNILTETVNELVSRQFLNTANGRLALSAEGLNLLERQMSNNAIINDVVDQIDSKDVSWKTVVKGLLKAGIKKFLGDKSAK